MATLRGEPVDRPAVSLYEIGGLVMNPDDPDVYNVYNDPSWKPLLRLAEEQSDIIRMRSAVRAQSHQAWESVQSGKGIRDEFFKVQMSVEGNRRTTRTTLTVSGRTMTSVTYRQQDIDTLWTSEHLLKSTDDMRAYLELPDEVFRETIDIAPLIEEENKLGDRGIVMVDTEDPICAAAALFSLEDYTIIAMTEPELFHRLLEKHARYIWHRTEQVARQFPGRLWRIYGPEYVTEPYLPPRFFEDYVVRYTGPMVKMIQKYGGFARIHCHGRLRNILDLIIKMGADAIDPVEPLPQGDVELKFVRQRYGDRLALFGNIEMTDIENLDSKEFATLIDRVLQDGTFGSGRGFVLMPTAAPYGRIITDQTLKNYRTMVAKTLDFAS
ncbi:MAG: hypothetical protein L0Y36_10640 [Planctomycetales bacterium]|nr:hypothetical protein [Planctomycetales bacterium]